ncbi:MAG: pilC [Frankiales bacterium]|nr:pilC [Frankiales bacterium]
MIRQRGRHESVPVAASPGGGANANVYALPPAGGDERFGVSFTVPSIPETKITVGEEKRVPSPSAGFFTKKVKPKELMHFSRQMAAFLRAGIPILDSLEMLALDCENPTLKLVLNDVEASLRQGSSLSESFDAHPKAFPQSYRSMVRSSELTGNLDVVLDRLASYLERDTEARDKIKSAMTYPAVIAVLSVAVIGLLTTFVLPRFKPFFASFHKQLPLPTRMLVNVANFMEHFWWLVLAVVVAGGIATFAFIHNPSTRPKWDKMKLGIPVLGEVFRYAIVERFCRVLGSMLQAGVPVSEALRISADAANNLYVRRQLEDARSLTLQGAGIAAPLSQVKLFPSAATQMIRVGESTGSLDKQLEQAASFFERELDYKIKRFTTIFEPAIIIVMGLVVGFVAVALVSAMYGMFSGGAAGSGQ